MIDFLKSVGISEGTINRMNELYDDSMKFNLEMNKENCIDIIIYMKKVGINNIEDLLLYKPDWFLKTTDDFIDLCTNDKTLVDRINEDYENVII